MKLKLEAALDIFQSNRSLCNLRSFNKFSKIPLLVSDRILAKTQTLPHFYFKKFLIYLFYYFKVTFYFHLYFYYPINLTCGKYAKTLEKKLTDSNELSFWQILVDI